MAGMLHAPFITQTGALLVAVEQLTVDTNIGVSKCTVTPSYGYDLNVISYYVTTFAFWTILH